MTLRKYKKIGKIIYIILIALFLIGCYDTRSFENVRSIKTGMTISEVELYMGKPTLYKYENDTTEKRMYVYDNVGNGIDMHITVIYCNEKAISIYE